MTHTFNGEHCSLDTIYYSVHQMDLTFLYLKFTHATVVFHPSHLHHFLYFKTTTTKMIIFPKFN